MQFIAEKARLFADGGFLFYTMFNCLALLSLFSSLFESELPEEDEPEVDPSLSTTKLY